MSLKPLLVGAALICAPVAGAPAMAAAASEARIESGPVRGAAAGGLRTFLGIPYAAPPVGDLRWKPPRPAQAWAAPRDATRFGAACAQSDTMGAFAKPSEAEDCLFLNVWAPAAGKVKRPVMVWIYGGGLRAGSSSDYDGSGLAREGVVVVSFNYRMGVLGYFANPALGEDNRSPNYGMLDQIAALEWVKRNIAAFGGDPDRVTIFGESAGARSVAVLLASPRAAGLFDGAILQSVGFDGVTNTQAAADAKGRAFAEAAGCAGDGACLRALPASRILSLQARYTISPVTGGAELPESLPAALAAGRFNRVPVIAGWTRNEATWQTALIEAGAKRPTALEDYRRTVGLYAAAGPPGLAEAVAKAYPAAENPGAALAAVTTDFGFVCPTKRMLRLLAPQVPTFAYEFADETAPQYNPPASFPYKAAHTSELQYLFPGFHGASGAQHRLNPAQRKLASRMRRLWADFARNGRADWKPYDPARDNLIVLRADRLAEQAKPYGDDRHCELWDSIPAP